MLFRSAGEITSGGLIKDGISTVRVRTFPATGFIHSALLGVSEIARNASAPLKTLQVTVNSGVFPILNDPAKERWWNLQLNCAAAWKSQNPMNLTPASEIEPLVTALGGDVPLGTALIRGETESGAFDVFIDKAPGLELFAPQEIAWRNEKWETMVGADSIRIQECARQLVNQNADSSTWDALRELVLGG